MKCTDLKPWESPLCRPEGPLIRRAAMCRSRAARSGKARFSHKRAERPVWRKKCFPGAFASQGTALHTHGTETEGLFEGCMMPCHVKKLYSDKHGIYIHPRSDVSFLKRTAFSIAVHKKYMADVW